MNHVARMQMLQSLQSKQSTTAETVKHGMLAGLPRCACTTCSRSPAADVPDVLMHALMCLSLFT